MSVIGKVESLWRYPVKSMRGEELDEAFAGYSGVLAIASSPSRARQISEDFRFSPDAINAK